MYFVVVYLYYVLFGINVFLVFGGVVYWFLKFIGWMMNEWFGCWIFWVVLVGFNFGFFLMYVFGLFGMLCCIYIYLFGMGWDMLNLLIMIGLFVFGIGIVMFVVNVLVSVWCGVCVGDNLWGVVGFEWLVVLLMFVYNFVVLLFVVLWYLLWEMCDDL